MKRSHLITIVVLVLFVAGAWLTTVTGYGDVETAEYNAHIELAEDYLGRGLFWKAAQEYREALEIFSSEEIWRAMLNAYASSVSQGDDSYDDYLEAAADAVSAFGGNEEFLLELVSLYTDEEDYTSAAKVLKKALEAGMSGEKVENAYLSSAYAYEIQWGSYEDFRTCTNGYYRVQRNGSWYYQKTTGGAKRYDNVTFLGPVGDDDMRILCMEDKIILIDEDGVPQGIVAGVMEEAGMYGEALVPIRINGKYAYYNLVGDKMFGDYQYAGAFEDGRAAVKNGDVWFFIDEDGERVDDTTYQEIVLTTDGLWGKGDVFVAKISGKYALINDEGETVAELNCTEVDVVTEDGLIAFCQNGRWGFADMEGNVVIAPSFADAKSFSNGLAAVSDGTHWGFVNEQGAVVIDYQFLDADYFNEDGTCMVKTDEGWQLLERIVKH